MMKARHEDANLRNISGSEERRVNFYYRRRATLAASCTANKTNRIGLPLKRKLNEPQTMYLNAWYQL